MKYSKELAEGLCEDIAKGLSIKQACKNAGIKKSTIYDWLDEDSTRYKSDFSDMVDSARKRKAEILENALFKRGKGFFYKEKKKYFEGNEEVRSEEKNKYFYSDRAAIYLLGILDKEKYGNNEDEIKDRIIVVERTKDEEE